MEPSPHELAWLWITTSDLMCEQFSIRFKSKSRTNLAHALINDYSGTGSGRACLVDRTGKLIAEHSGQLGHLSHVPHLDT